MIALNDQLLVSIKEKTASDSGVYLPESNTYIDEEGTILSVGPNVQDIKNLTVGSVVIFKSWAPDVVKRGKEKFSFVSEERILGKL